jgi:glycosyltransferase 2 family protein
MRSSSRKLLYILFAVAVIGFVIYRSSGLLHSGDFFANLWKAVRRANPALLALSTVAIYACYAIRALRWQVLQRNLGPSRFWQIYAMTLAGFAAVLALGRPGEPIRVLLLARKEKLPTADLFGIYLVERILDTASTLVVAALALLLIKSGIESKETAGKFVPAFQAAGALLGVGVLGAIAFLVFLRVRGTALLERRLAPWLGAHNWKARVARILMGFARGVQTMRTWGDLALAALYSALHWILVLFVYQWVIRAFGGSLADFRLGDAMLVMAFSLVGSIVQLPGIGGGSQLASILVFTKVFGIETELAAAAAIVIWLITFAAVAVIGLPILLHQGLSLAKLREMAAEEQESLESSPSGETE